MYNLKEKIKKTANITGGVLFLIALAIHIKVTLDDPFVMLSDKIIAQIGYGLGTSSGSGIGSSSGALLGRAKENPCPDRYDTTEVTTTTATFTTRQNLGVSVKTSRLVKYLLSGEVEIDSDGGITYKYTKTTTRTIEAMSVSCPGLLGICFTKSCGE